MQLLTLCQDFSSKVKNGFDTTRMIAFNSQVLNSFLSLCSLPKIDDSSHNVANMCITLRTDQICKKCINV